MRLKLILLALIQTTTLLCAQAQNTQPLDAKIAAVINTPEFRHALFGIEFLPQIPSSHLDGVSTVRDSGWVNVEVQN